MRRIVMSIVPTIALLAGTAAHAECGIAAGSVRILSNDFAVLRLVADEAKGCASPTVTVTANQTTEHKNLQVPALSAKPAEYTVAFVANNSIAPLLNAGLIRPLDELVAKYGQDLLPNQLIRVGGKTMAVAFDVNSQHLFYRRDILAQAGVAAPKSYEDVLAAARAIHDKGLLRFPVAAADKPGWDLGAEFVNLYLGTGGDFFAPDSAALALDTDKARLVLHTMKALTQFMAPDFLSYDSDEIKAVYMGGKVSMMDGWASYAGAVIDPKGPDPAVSDNTVLAAAPTIGGGKIPAAALWWDGFSLATNISDADADASFRAMMHAIRPAVAAEHPDAAPWLIKGYVPGPASVGVIATARGGARAYPMLPYMGLLHTALSNEIGGFLQGQKDEAKTLADVQAAYAAAARGAGFVKD